MVLCDDESVYRRMLFLRDHGRLPGDVSFRSVEVAFKYKMSELQAAFGRVQLARIEELITRIVDLQLRRVDKLTGELGFRLSVTEAAKTVLAREGYDPAFGARPLKRAIQRRLQDPLAMKLLEDDVPEGAKHL